MKILIAGSNGMIGSAATRHLTECGHEVVRLVRHTPSLGEVWWNPDAGEIDTAGLEASTVSSTWPPSAGPCAGRPKPKK
jgi:nucleoside-diphosphate-sugar epimerase